ncbi:MAG: YncE family protein [Armatimonadota bacterium]
MSRWVTILVTAVLALVLSTSARSAARTSLLYAFNVGTKDVSVIDMETNAKVGTKTLGAAVRWLSNEQDFYDGRLVWTYEDRDDGKVDALAIDPAAMKVVRRIRLGTGPGFSVVLTPDRRLALADVAGDNRLAVIDTKSSKVVRQIPTGLFPCDLDRIADGRFAYVPERDQNTVAMIEMQSLRVVKRFDMGKHTEPHMLRVSPDNKTVWVMNGMANSLVVLDARTLEPIAKTAMGKVPVTLAFSPDSQFAYISHFSDNFISVVDTRTFKEVSRIKVAQGLAVVAFRPDGKFAYVTAMSANAVAVIDTATLKVVRKVPAGKEPWGLLVFPVP